ncbi:MAG TPA: hypothetical protein VGN18_13995 [Jatrophihabitans sp.]|jgi:hypothetical protein|uniref:PGAP1-like alpha/beta domain-containing protein n=1 Tax=Jatrophihabitans sp. TaxID=1932789 RepID=UPI002E044205|nr:hypothetical protein [Jatrophihabitans sp.]
MGGVTVDGGTGGITAHCDDLRTLARRLGEVSADTLHSAWSLHGYLAQPVLLESALLDPVGFATFEADLLLALDGLHGLTPIGLRAAALDLELRAAATAYELADHLASDAILGAIELPIATQAASLALARTRDPLGAAEQVVALDPALADTIIDGLGVPGLLASGARSLPDGHGVARPLGADTGASTPPRRLTDVVADLDRRNADGHHGAVDVRILTLADGSRRAIVDITGTKSWSLGPTSDVTSLTTNGRALVGLRTAYEQGVLAAMRAAGVRRTDQVMLVGHSEGGMVAVTTARDAVTSGEFDVTHVVTAGSPVGLTVGQVPRQVQVLALENTRDVVPHLDGRANPDQRNVTTASGARGDGTVGGDHSVHDAYLPLAGDVQTSHDRSVHDFLTGADGFFRAERVVTQTYQVIRTY